MKNNRNPNDELAPPPPLSGLKVVEFAGIGPAPFGAMMLSDLGASVLRIERAAAAGLGVERPLEYNYVMRGRNSVSLDLKKSDDLAIAADLVASSDVLIEGFRPGVMERLRLGPDDCFARNPALVYARMTGWGQDGPYASVAGHDLNYISITGALAMIGRAGQLPAPPLNALGDFAGGGMLMVVGILSALYEARKSGAGQVVDASVVDGTLSLINQFFGMRAAGIWSLERGSNFLDSGAPYYDVYRCADGKLVALAAIEDKFFALFLELSGLERDLIELKRDRSRWPELREIIAARFAENPRDLWADIFEGTDACVSPVLDMDEAKTHPHLRARNAFISVDGLLQAAPAPRFSRSGVANPRPPGAPNILARDEVLSWWGGGAFRSEGQGPQARTRFLKADTRLQGGDRRQNKESKRRQRI